MEGLVDRDALTRKYHLGPLLYELGLLAQPRYQLSELCNDALEHIADSTQDTVYLSERRGPESICTNRALGDYPIKALTLDIGIRRPMGVGAGGLAILSVLPPAEAEEVIAANAHRYGKFATFHVDFLRAAVAEGRERGYSFLDSAVTPGLAAVGVAFPAENPVAAISSRLNPARRAEVARDIQHQVRLVCAAMASQTRADEAARRKPSS